MSEDREAETSSRIIPEVVRVALETFGKDYLEEIFDKETGQPDSFWRWLIRKVMEDGGRIPPNSDS